MAIFARNIQAVLSRDYLRQTASLDACGLAFLRISFGAILLVDLYLRATALAAHYTDAGILPRAVRRGLSWDYNEPWHVSLHMLSGEAWWQAALFAAAAVAAAMLLVGYRTQLALAASWLLLVSLHGRNPLVLQGGDVLLRCLLFWMLFAPVGRRWSIDALSARQQSAADRAPCGPYITSLGTAAILVQLSAMYLFTALLKNAPSWRSDFTAVQHALAIDHYTAPLGYRLLEYPALLKALTSTSLGLEVAAPLLLLCPVGFWWIRVAVPAAMVAFHCGLGLTMTLGTFPWICSAAWLALLPAEVWDALERRMGIAGASAPASEPPSAKPSRLWPTAIAAAMLLFVVTLNVRRLAHPAARVAGPLGVAGQMLGLSQYWNMFAPGPAEYGGWFRIEGRTAAGRLVNLYDPSRPLPAAKPALVSGLYPTQHWRRAIVTLWEYEDQPYRDSVLTYFVRRWNEAHPQERLINARIVQIRTRHAEREEITLATWHYAPPLDNRAPLTDRLAPGGKKRTAGLDRRGRQ